VREEHGVAGEDGLVGDVLGEHGLADAVGTEQDEVSAFLEEFQSQGSLEQGSIDLFGPIPVKVGDRLEASEPALDASPFERAPGAFGGLAADDFLEQSARCKLVLYGASQEVV
jgi:hypothetical protein